jgi:hypothetical protein
MIISHDERHTRLAPVIEGYRKTPFAWQVHDCVLFAARCVDAQIGTRLEFNIQRDYKYNGPVAALRIVTEAGGWEPIISRYLGPSVKPSELEFGDVVLGHAKPPFERTSLLGICDEDLIIVPGSERLEWLPMSNAMMGWKLENVPRWRVA